MMQLFCTKAQTGARKKGWCKLGVVCTVSLSCPEEPVRASFFPSLHLEASQSRHRKDSVLVF